MRTPKATEGKLHTGGALRGAQNTAKKLVIKTELQDVAQIPFQPSRELLKQRIIEKRRARGESDIQVQFDRPVKHELSPEEIERRERRKEQNRRAASRCRQKKKLLQVDVVQSFAVMQDENERLEAEITQLRQDKLVLQNELDKHMLSGACKQLKVENSENAACPQYVPQSSSSGSQVMPLTSAVAPASNAVLRSAALSAPSAETTSIPFLAYLADLGPIDPSETFMDLPANFEELKSGGFPFATVPCDPNGTLDTEKVLQSLPSPQSRCMGQFLSPCSPVPDTSRHSVSSVSSEWSSVSDQSHGFCPEGYYSEPANQRLSSTPLLSESVEQVNGLVNHQDFAMNLDYRMSDDDDVFEFEASNTKYLVKTCYGRHMN